MSAPMIDSLELNRVVVGEIPTDYGRRGTGEPMLFLPDARLTGLRLPLYDLLAERFDVVVPVHPGFGASTLPDWLTDFTDLALHYAAVLDELNLGRVHLAGHGFGGWIAAEFAVLFPERLRSLSLLAPEGLSPDDDEPMPDTFRMDPAELAQALAGDDQERWLPVLQRGGPGESMVRDYREQTAVARVAWNPRYDVKLERRLRRVDIPARVLVPERDGYVAPSVARRYAAALPSAELITITGQIISTEHLFVLQEPELVAADLIALLDSEVTA